MAKKLSPIEQKSSKTILDALRAHTQGMMKGKMDGLKKVTVAADSKEGLEKGLELAKKIAGKSPESSEESDEECLEDPIEEASETPEEESSEESSEELSETSPEDMSAEELDAYIRKLQELKFKKK